MKQVWPNTCATWNLCSLSLFTSRILKWGVPPYVAQHFGWALSLVDKCCTRLEMMENQGAVKQVWSNTCATWNLCSLSLFTSRILKWGVPPYVAQHFGWALSLVDKCYTRLEIMENQGAVKHVWPNTCATCNLCDLSPFTSRIPKWGVPSLLLGD